MTVHDAQSAARELAETEGRLSELRRLQIELEQRIVALREGLGLLATRQAGPTDSTSPNLTAAEKVSLFLRLFRGRDDVFPRLWSNPKTGKKGYAPACSNEWVRVVCEKPRVRCGECPNRLDTLFLALPISWKGTLVQYAGRLHRDSPGKTSVRVIDYVDRNVPMLARMWERRRKGYRTLDYAVADAPPAARATQTLLGEIAIT